MPILIFNIALALLLLAALVGVARPYGRWKRMHFAMLSGGLALLLLVMGGLMVTERLLSKAAADASEESADGASSSASASPTGPVV